ncbi:MAG: GFA family protein [Bacteroidales bacterium]
MIHKHTGACLCKRITFEIVGDFDSFFLCHCKWCRKGTGSAHAANLFSSTAKLMWLTGEDIVKTYYHKSTNHVKSFCSNCGSALPNIQMSGTLLVVPAGCLDSEISILPQGHIFYAYKAKWDSDLHKVQVFDRLPE